MLDVKLFGPGSVNHVDSGGIPREINLKAVGFRLLAVMSWDLAETRLPDGDAAGERQAAPHSHNRVAKSIPTDKNDAGARAARKVDQAKSELRSALRRSRLDAEEYFDLDAPELRIRAGAPIRSDLVDCLDWLQSPAPRPASENERWENLDPQTLLSASRKWFWLTEVARPRIFELLDEVMLEQWLNLGEGDEYSGEAIAFASRWCERLPESDRAMSALVESLELMSKGLSPKRIAEILRPAVDGFRGAPSDALVERYNELLASHELASGLEIPSTARPALEGPRFGSTFPTFVSHQFRGREKELDLLIPTDGTVAGFRRVVVGDPSVGKSAFANEYFRNQGDHYGTRIWVSGHQATTLRDDLANALNLTTGEVTDRVSDDERRRLIVRSLEQVRRPWLLVIDNADRDAVAELFAHEPIGGDTLITSTDRDWDGFDGRPIELGNLDVPDITRVIRDCAPDATDEHVERIAARDDVPIGITILIAQSLREAIKAYGLKFADEASRPEMERLIDQVVDAGVDETVETQLARAAGDLEGARRTTPTAARPVAEILSFLDDREIPREVINGLNRIGEPALASDADTRHALKALRARGVLAGRGPNAYIQEVTGAAIHSRLSDDQKSLRVFQAASLLLLAMPKNPSDGAAHARTVFLSPHVIDVINWADRLHVNKTVVSELESRHALYLAGSAEWETADRSHRNATLRDERMMADPALGEWDANDRARVVRRKARYGTLLRRRGQKGDGLRILLEARDEIERLENCDPIYRIHVYDAVARIMRVTDAPEEMMTAAQKAAEMAREQHRVGKVTSPEAAKSLELLVDAHRIAGGAAHLESALEVSTEIFELLSIPPVEEWEAVEDEYLRSELGGVSARCVRAYGLILRELGRLKESMRAQRFARRIRALHRRAGHYEFHAHHDSIGRLLIQFGEWDEAMEECEAGRVLIADSFSETYDHARAARVLIANAQIGKATAVHPQLPDTERTKLLASARNTLNKACEEYLLEAELGEQAVDSWREGTVPDPTSLDHAWCMLVTALAEAHLARLERDASKLEWAQCLVNNVREFRTRKLSASHQHLASCDEVEGHIHCSRAVSGVNAPSAGFKRAQSSFDKARELRKAAFETTDHPLVAEIDACEAELIRLRIEHGAREPAKLETRRRELLERCLDVRARLIGDDAPITVGTRALLGE